MSLPTVKGQRPGTEPRSWNLIPPISQLHLRAGERQNCLSVTLHPRSTGLTPLSCAEWLITPANQPGVYSAAALWQTRVRGTGDPEHSGESQWHQRKLSCIVVIKEGKETGPCWVVCRSSKVASCFWPTLFIKLHIYFRSQWSYRGFEVHVSRRKRQVIKMQSMSIQVRQAGLGGLDWKGKHRTRESIFNSKLQKLHLAATLVLMGFTTL